MIPDVPVNYNADQSTRTPAFSFKFVTETETLVLRPLLEDRGRIT